MKLPLRSSVGPVVQSIASLLKSLGEDWISLTVHVLSKSVAVTFLLKNCKELLHCKSSLHFYSKNGSIFSSPGRGPGRAVVLPPGSASAAASALAKC